MKEDKHMKVLQIIRMRGPVIPSQINKEINVDVMMGSAILSELVDKGTLKMSCLKVGNSSLYYAPGQEYMLQNFAKHLNPKDKETMDLLRDKKVLRDKALEPLPRVSLRQIKDFAKPLNVKVNNEDVVFWKWYLVSNEEATQIIKKMIEPDLARAKEAREQVKEPVRAPEPAREQQPAQVQKEEPVMRRPVSYPVGMQTIIKDVQKKVAEEKQPVQERITTQSQAKKEKQVMLDAPRVERQAPEKERQREKAPAREAEPSKEMPKEEPKDKFFRKVKAYFDENKIEIVDFKILRKESDMEFTVKIPSPVGSLMYFCKAKNKKKFTDGDLSSVFLEGQRKNMPILFIVTGELTKKASDMLGKDFKNMSVRNI